MQYMLLRTKKFTPKLRDLRQSNFLNHPLSRSPPEFLHQLGNFTPAALVPLVRFCISACRDYASASSTAPFEPFSCPVSLVPVSHISSVSPTRSLRATFFQELTADGHVTLHNKQERAL